MKVITIIDLALYAASTCSMCRTHGRPNDETDQEHGDQFRHGIPGLIHNECRAAQIWGLIRNLESQK